MPVQIGVFTILKPLAAIWFGLKVLDDVSLITRVVRLGAVLLPDGGRNDEAELCDLCDDVMGDLLVQGGIDVLPCKLLCFHIPKCVEMCESVKDVSKTSTKYPCVAAGYCNAIDEKFMTDSDIDCNVGPFFTCRPSKYCHRVRNPKSLNWNCKLRPGIGRWIGLQNSISNHAGALAVGLLSQPHCSEPNAGPYCIAKPKGFGLFCEILNSILSLLYGGYKSIIAIESPGGDDDTQWLTFWLILAVILSIERLFARPILSTVPLYYETKLLITIWLLWFQGAERSYRKLRHFMMSHNIIIKRPGGGVGVGAGGAKDAGAMGEANSRLDILEETGKALIRKRLEVIKKEIITEKSTRQLSVSKRMSSVISSNSLDELLNTVQQDYDDEDYAVDDNDDGDGIDKDDDELEGSVSAIDKVNKLCDFLLSSEGTDEIMNSKELTAEERASLLDLATYHVQFHPKFLYIRLLGVVDGPEGEFPIMDEHNGLADPYITCRLIFKKSHPKGSRDKMVEEQKKRKQLIRRSVIVDQSYRTWRYITTKKETVTSTVKYRTRRPQWNELLELPLSNTGYIDASGNYRNDAISKISLRIEAWDADVGVWGNILRFTPICLILLISTAMVGYVFGLTDILFTKNQMSYIQSFYIGVGGMLVLSYIMANVRKADDDPIGQCTVPLSMLMDKAEHSLRLTLREHDKYFERSFAGSFRNFMYHPEDLAVPSNTTSSSSSSPHVKVKQLMPAQAREDDDDDFNIPTNSVGGYGVIRVKLMLAEN